MPCDCPTSRVPKGWLSKRRPDYMLDSAAQRRKRYPMNALEALEEEKC